MIRILSGGKKHDPWVAEAVKEYEKRLKKPFDVTWEFFDDEKLAKYLDEWRFKPTEYVIITDERGKNISSPEFSKKLEDVFNSSRSVAIVIGGAYGVPKEARNKADFVWSFSNLVFPHQLMRAMLIEQIYRAGEISKGSNYHHA
ncbi:MAG: 23S rRNA (pseudouridine(1915)-N(3))-methyltransferase RlmH [Candidatus Saccharibacteria bacterium]|nr:23S rRNA (pseudouridine(1915)-N(3))-methyltransferase RlmH [Candidatus Saccharibacteria bacterium]